MAKKNLDSKTTDKTTDKTNNDQKKDKQVQKKTPGAVKTNNDKEAFERQYNLFTGTTEKRKNEYNKEIVTVDTKRGVRNVNTRGKNSIKGKGSNDFERKGEKITKVSEVEILQELSFKYNINLKTEYYFDRAGKYIEGASDRDYRLDYAFPALKIGIEMDGGLSNPESGHRSISGIMRDMEKTNRASMNKWYYFRFSYFHTERYFKAIIEAKIKQLLKIKHEPTT